VNRAAAEIVGAGAWRTVARSQRSSAIRTMYSSEKWRAKSSKEIQKVPSDASR
tara:strand:+ start:412 stop:570 length:159 start_codon:yes stop_codon:yes gene_type:complete